MYFVDIIFHDNSKATTDMPSEFRCRAIAYCAAVSSLTVMSELPLL